MNKAVISTKGNLIDVFLSDVKIEYKTLFETEKEIKMERLIKFRNKIYECNSILLDEKIFFLKELQEEIINEDECFQESEIKCPYCGFEKSNSLEEEEYDYDCECGRCGAVFSYEREIQVTYTSKIVKRPQIQEF